MIRRSIAVAVLVASAAGLVAFACSPFDGDAAKTGPVDAATSETSSAPADSGASPEDSDVRTDPPPVAFGCDAAICDDFEREPSAVAQGWTSFQPHPERATIDEHHSVSGTRALHVSVPDDIPGEGEAQAVLSRDIPVAGATKLTLDFHYWMKDARRVNLATMKLHHGPDVTNGGGRIILAVLNETQFACGSQDYNEPSDYDEVVRFSLPTLGKWIHVVITADFASTRPVLHCTVGEVGKEETVDGVLEDALLPESITPNIGVTYAFSGAAAYSVFFDDVRVSATK